MPKKEIFKTGENKADKKNDMTMPKPATKSQDFGNFIFPSEKRAAVQKIIDTDKPITNNKLLEISTGILVKGKKKTGNKTMTTKSDQKEILSKIFDNIFFILFN